MFSKRQLVMLILAFVPYREAPLTASALQFVKFDEVISRIAVLANMAASMAPLNREFCTAETLLHFCFPEDMEHFECAYVEAWEVFERSSPIDSPFQVAGAARDNKHVHGPILGRMLEDEEEHRRGCRHGRKPLLEDVEHHPKIRDSQQWGSGVDGSCEN